MSDLRWIERALEGAQVHALEDYFPATARGELQARRGEILVEAGDLIMVGPGDGTVVPIDAANLEAMPENIFDFDRLLTLVDAASASPGTYTFDMGYADVTLEHGALVAQVRDGNHRTFGAALVGADPVPVMLSDNVSQQLRAGEQDALYRAIRKAQRDQGLPQLTRRRQKAKGTAVAALAAAEQDLLDAQAALLEAQQDFLRRWGFHESGYPAEEQLARAGVFWRERARAIGREALEGDELVDRIWALNEQRAEAAARARAAREAAGLDRQQRYDPATGRVVSL